MAQRVSSPEFVGRAPEVGVLIAALARAQDGRAGAVFVAGESGVGKTRLLRELERRAVEQGARVLRGECLAFGAGELPYAPIAGAVRDLQRQLGPEAFDALAGPTRADLARLVPELATGAEDERAPAGMAATGAPIAQAKLFGMVRGLLDRLAAATPVVLTVEDLHWADRSTLEFLSSLLSWLRDERLLLVCTYRSDELHRRHPLRPFLAAEERREAVERVDLRPFSLAELSTQVRGILGDAPDPALVGRLHERSEGNAFFAEELLAATAAAAGPLPTSLRDVLTLRLEAVPGDGREALRVAAAAGRRASHRLLAAVSRLDEADLLEALRAAVAQHVLVQDADGYAFRHALLQEAAYEDLLAGERTALHLALAEVLSADPSLASAATPAAELAHHWRAAHRLPDALAAHVRAALEAEAVYAYAEATQQYESALELWGEVPDAAELAAAELGGAADAGDAYAAVLGRAAEATQLSGDHPRAVALGRQAVALADAAGDVVRSALARERLGRYLWLASDSDGALDEHREAVRLLPVDPPTPELARVLAALGQILMLRGPGDESQATCERAIAIARAVGARGVEGHALNSYGVSRCAVGDWEAAERALREAMAIAEELGDADDLCRSYVNLADCVDRQGRIEEAVALALEGAAVAERLGLDTYDQFERGEAGWRLARLGRLDEAEAVIAAGFEGRPTGTSAVVLLSARGHVCLRRGRLDEAVSAFRQARDIYGAMSDSMWVGNATAGELDAELWRPDADPETAWRRAVEVLAMVSDHEYVYYSARLHATLVRAAADVALRARSLGDDELAAEAQRSAAATIARLGELLAPERWPGGPVPADTIAFEAQCTAELARGLGRADADAWAQAAEAFARLGYDFEVAYARWRQAEALAPSDRAAAALALTEADAFARQLGALRLRAEVEALARRARIELGGEPVAPAVDSDQIARLGLTDRERAVLELVAEGRTNREIGGALFMAEKTASVHVSRILGKLGVKSRVEAATVAYRLGLGAQARSAPGDGGRG